MKTLKLIVYFSILTFTTYGQIGRVSNKYFINPEAKKLYDSAVTLIHSFNIDEYQKAILLLDQAIKIDSNYFNAYHDKLIFHCRIGQYDKAIQPAKEIKRLRPNSPDFCGTVGGLYYRCGDTINALKYFMDALVLYNWILDTMNIKNIDYDELLINKAQMLILTGDKKRGNAILKDL